MVRLCCPPMLTATVLWSDSDLIIEPAFPFLEERLKYGHRELDREFDCVTVSDMALYRKDNAGRIITFQGLMHKVVGWLKEAGVVIIFRDLRVFSAKPQLHKMKGFRGSQREFTSRGLSQMQSGVFKAPTRWGKTTVLTNILRAYPRCRTVVTAPGIDLIEQLEVELRAALPDREVTGLYSGSKKKFQGDDITVVSMDSLFKCDHNDTELVVIDEPHSVVTDSRGINLDMFRRARRLAVGATIDGRFDGADILVQALIGPTLVCRTFLEGVAEKAICPIDVIMLDLPFKSSTFCYDRDEAYRMLVYENKILHAAIAEINNTVLAKTCQTISFIANERQADKLAALVEDGVVAMAKRMGKKDRAAMFAKMKIQEVKRCLASGIYSTGVTFSGLRAALNCNGGGPCISVVQKVGRLAEILPNKYSGLYFDFLLRPDDVNPDLPFSVIQDVHRKKGWNCVWRDSHARVKLYKSIGYNVHHVKTISELASLVRRLQHPTFL